MALIDPDPEMEYQSPKTRPWFPQALGRRRSTAISELAIYEKRI
jgi:hypothetical protein